MVWIPTSLNDFCNNMQFCKFFSTFLLSFHYFMILFIMFRKFTRADHTGNA